MKKLPGFIFLFMLLFYTSAGNCQETANKKTVIRVLTYNILHGATTNGNGDLDIVAKVINDLNPDLVAVQEMDFKTNRVRQRDITTELALKTRMSSIFMKAVDYDGGEYGQSLLSRYTFLETKKILLPGIPEKESRIAAAAKIILPAGDTIRFVGTHLDHIENSPDRLEQAKAINILLDNNKHPAILAGDLNDVPESETIKILESHWTSTYDKKAPAPTYPSHSPEKKIDYIMFSPSSRWKVLKKEVICHEVASDHCAYLVVLELLPGK